MSQKNESPGMYVPSQLNVLPEMNIELFIYLLLQ